MAPAHGKCLIFEHKPTVSLRGLVADLHTRPSGPSWFLVLNLRSKNTFNGILYNSFGVILGWFGHGFSNKIRNFWLYFQTKRLCNNPENQKCKPIFDPLKGYLTLSESKAVFLVFILFRCFFGIVRAVI